MAQQFEDQSVNLENEASVASESRLDRWLRERKERDELKKRQQLEKRNKQTREYRAKLRKENPGVPRKWAKDYRNKNKEYYKSYAKRWNQENKHKIKEYWLKSEYGISLEEYNLLLIAQDNKCAICRSSDPKKSSFSVDHDHNTGRIRGLLCHNCNVGLGGFRDTPEFLQSAIRYLAK